MHTPEQQAYIDKHKLVCVQRMGSDSLYKSPWGCRTIENIMEMSEIQHRYDAQQAIDRAKRKQKPIQVSEALMMQHLHCIDEYGCGLFEGEGY